MNFFSTTFLNQSKPSLYNLHALKSLFLVISISTTQIGSPISSNFTNLAGHEAEAFAIVNDLTQVNSEPTRVPDRAGDKANTLDLFLTSNPNIYSPPTVSCPLGDSDNCLITLRHDFFPQLDRRLAPQRVFHYSKADWDSLRTFYSSYHWSSGFCYDPSSLASFINDAILLGMDYFVPSSSKPGKKIPKWFNSQCAKAVNKTNRYFKEWKRLQTQHSRTSVINSRKTCSETMKNAKSSFVQCIQNKTASCQACSLSYWSMAKVVCHNFCQSTFPPLECNSDSSSTTPSSKDDLFASVFASNSSLDDKGVKPHHLPPSEFTMSYVTH